MTQTEPNATHAPNAADQACELNFDVAGMDCASCVAHVEKAAGNVAGVEDVRVNLARGRAAVRFDPQRATPEQIATAITDAGYPAAPQHENAASAEAARIAHHAEHAQSWAR